MTPTEILQDALDKLKDFTILKVKPEGGDEELMQCVSYVAHATWEVIAGVYRDTKASIVQADKEIRAARDATYEAREAVGNLNDKIIAEVKYRFRMESKEITRAFDTVYEARYENMKRPKK